MNDELDSLANKLKKPQERNLYLEECNLRYVSILELLTTNSDFQADLNREKNQTSIFKATQQQIKRLFLFTYAGFFINSDTNNFDLAQCYPPASQEELERMVDDLIMDGSFAWAINQNHPVLHSVRDGEQTLILHVLSTQSRIRGMFVGLLPYGQATVDAPSLNALSIILSNTAYALESTTLYDMLHDHMNNLIQKVDERTKELQYAQLQAEEANRAKSSFLANMSHELRTPLNATIGFTDVVLSKSVGPLNTDQEEYLGYVLQSSRHLLALINDILDLSKVEANMMELVYSEVPIRDLLRNIIIMVKELAHHGDIQLREKFAADLPEIVGVDERRLKQILYNLLSNAIKFTPTGGSVTIEAHSIRDFSVLPPVVSEQLAEIAIAGRCFMKIAVSDTGIGIKSDDLESIFNPFEQADNSVTREFEGTGLGLALTRKLLALHGGVIWAESAGLGKGSNFQIILPV
jgi:signal transduction histidine kinase